MRCRQLTNLMCIHVKAVGAKRILLIFAAFALIPLLLACAHGDPQPQRGYLLKCLDWTSHVERNKGRPVIEVMAVDTHADSSWQVEESYYGRIRGKWCLYVDSAAFYQNYEEFVPISLTTLPVISSFLAQAAHRHPPDAEITVLLDRFNNTCCPDRDLIGALGWIFSRSDSGDPGEDLLDFYCIYNSRTREAKVVDTGRIPPRQRSPAPFFDSEGTFLYYKLDGLCKRYELASGRIDTILAGDYPIIPWNGHAVIVYSSKDERFRLLDDTLGIVAEIKGEIEGEVTAAFKVSDSVFVFGSHYKYVAFPPIPVDVEILTTFYELDFKRLRQTELYRRGSISCFLIDAQPLE